MPRAAHGGGRGGPRGARLTKTPTLTQPKPNPPNPNPNPDQVLEAHVIASLAPSTQQLLLIGDHQQLRPSAACYELGLKFGLTVSLFERAFLSRAPLVKLRTQRRMRPTISRLIKPLYPELLDHPSARGRPNVSGLARNVHFITHAAPEEYQDGGVLSPRNVHEARRCGLVITAAAMRRVEALP